MKMVAPLIREYLHGDLAECVQCLRQGQLSFEDVNDLLERQFNRLTDLEQRVINWLAIHREWSTLTEIQADLFPIATLGDVLKRYIRCCGVL